MKSILVDFDLLTGLSDERESVQRRLSDMDGMYADKDAYDAMIVRDDTLVYEFFDMGLPETEGGIAFGTSMTYPGKVGSEFFMTKGHFHSILDTAEVYYCLRGKGIMLMEDSEGNWEARELEPGLAVYVPEGYAHRSINTSPDDTLVTFYAFRADAGHDYGTIETKGFRKIVVEKDGIAQVIDNPKWKE